MPARSAGLAPRALPSSCPELRAGAVWLIRSSRYPRCRNRRAGSASCARSSVILASRRPPTMATHGVFRIGWRDAATCRAKRAPMSGSLPASRPRNGRRVRSRIASTRMPPWPAATSCAACRQGIAREPKRARDNCAASCVGTLGPSIGRRPVAIKGARRLPAIAEAVCIRARRSRAACSEIAYGRAWLGHLVSASGRRDLPRASQPALRATGGNRWALPRVSKLARTPRGIGVERQHRQSQ